MMYQKSGKHQTNKERGGQRIGLRDNPYNDMQIMYHWFLCHCSWSDIPHESKYHVNRRFDNANTDVME